MRKRVHGKQSIPAIILYSPERAVKFPILTLALIPSASQVPESPALPIYRIYPIHAGYRRTLYTSNVPEQSNIIFKDESRERLTLMLQRANPASRADLTFRLQDWP
jgi:hypothetical protein